MINKQVDKTIHEVQNRKGDNTSGNGYHKQQEWRYSYETAKILSKTWGSQKWKCLLTNPEWTTNIDLTTHGFPWGIKKGTAALRSGLKHINLCLMEPKLPEMTWWHPGRPVRVGTCRLFFVQVEQTCQNIISIDAAGNASECRNVTGHSNNHSSEILMTISVSMRLIIWSVWKSRYVRVIRFWSHFFRCWSCWWSMSFSLKIRGIPIVPQIWWLYPQLLMLTIPFIH